jgi:type I restriction enzyme S subunit
MTGRAAAKDVRPGDYALSVGMPEKPCPPGWAWVALLDVAEMATGHTPSRQFPEYWADGDIPWVTATDANPADGGVINDTLEKINRLGLENSAAVLLPKGTVCLSRTGASIGYTVILGSEMATNQGFVNYICSEALNNHYLLHLFMAERRALFSFGEGSAHKTIYFPEAKAFHICLPPLPEQHRIVEKIEELFSDLDAGVSALQRAKANLKRYRASVLKSAVEGRLTEEWWREHPQAEDGQMLLDRILRERREKWEKDQLLKFKETGKEPPKNWESKYEEPSAPDTSELPELPRGWVLATVEQVIQFARYGSSSKTDEDISGVPVLRMGNLFNGGLDLDKLKYLPDDHDEFPDLLLQDGDLLFNRTNSPELVGKSAVYRGIPSPCSYASYLIALRFFSGCLPDWLAFYLNSVFGRRWVKTVVVQQVGQANVNGTKLQALSFPLPPLTEQEQIVALVEERLSQIDSAQKTIDAELIRAKRLRQSILKRAFEGKLVPQDPKDEPASVLLERIKPSREHEQPKKTKKVKSKTT